MITENEITLAGQMRDLGLAWEPSVGHYVYDEAGLIEVPSPFQPKVYFILDLKHFLRRADTIETLKSKMYWLPQWHHARQIARDLGISEGTLTEKLLQQEVFSQEKELETLYRLITEKMADH